MTLDSTRPEFNKSARLNNNNKQLMNISNLNNYFRTSLFPGNRFFSKRAALVKFLIGIFLFYDFDIKSHQLLNFNFGLTLAT